MFLKVDGTMLRVNAINGFILCLLLFTSTSFSQLDSSLPPGSNFDLSVWKLQSLDASNALIEVTGTALKFGYTSNLFYTHPVDGSMVCLTPSNGTTTSGTSYPRVELRQMTGGANWAVNDAADHWLSAECKVVSVAAAKPQTIFGQVHGSETSSELLKLRWTGDQPGQCYIEARYQNNDAAKTEYGVTLADGLSLGQRFTYSIYMKSGKITATVNGASASQTYTSAYYGTSDRYYFKAGNYLQYHSTDANIYGITQFYSLMLSAPNAVDNETNNPVKFELKQNYPNPFNPSTEISFYLPFTEKVKLTVFDISGTEVALLVNQTMSPGSHSIMFEGANLKSGVYFCRMTAGSYKETKKLVLLK